MKKNYCTTLFIFIINVSILYSQCPVVSPIGVDGCRYSFGSVELGASGSTGYYNWYDNAVGGNYLGFGTPFYTPSISTTTTYYVAAADTNNALNFDGTNDYVALGNPAQLQITGDMTIEMWVKPNSFSGRRNPYAKAYGGEGTITQETNGALSYYYGTNGGNSTPYQGFGSGTALNLGQWNHIAIVRDLTNMRLYWYINGALTAQTVATYPVATAGLNNATIGSGYVSNYDGQIDELRIWNVAKSQVQIQNAMNTCLTGLEANLAAYYQLNTGVGATIAYDLSPFANNGVLTNMNPPTDWVVANYGFICPSCESPRTAVTATIGGGAPVNLGNDTTLICETSTLTLDAGVGYSNYLWSTSETTSTINVSTSGSYWVQVDNGGGCVDTDTISVSFPSGSKEALDFDGINDYVALGNPAQLQITGDMTIEMWVKPDNFSARRNPYAKAYGGEGTITQETNGALSYYYGTNGGNGSPYQGFGSGAALNLGQWNHIAIVRDLTNMRLYWYINGVLSAQTVATYPVATAGLNNATIGSGYVSNYDGQIDELRIWNTARTQTEIRNKMCSKVKSNETGLVAYYCFDDGSGTTLTESTGSGLNGTLTNGPLWSISGAAIGDTSTYLYSVSWAAQSLTLATSCGGGENLTVSNMSGTPNGVHIYSVGTVPNTTTGIVGLGSNNRYFGVFKVNDAAATYTATYDYAGNSNVGTASEPTVALFVRSNNSSLLWTNTGATLDTSSNTLVATAQSTEFILGSTGTPLPITLVNFNATVNVDKVDLKWVTSSEVNNDYFTIERSKNALIWEEVLKTKGANNSNVNTEYFEIDYSPYEGVSYYRLKQTDYDGNFEYFNIVPVKVDRETIGMSLFPNPIKRGEELKINLESVKADVLIVIRDAKGQEYYSKAEIHFENNQLIAVPINSDILAGLYIVTASSENQIYSQKLLVK